MEHNGVGQAMKRCPIQPARVHGRKPAQPEKEHPGEGPCSIRRHKMGLMNFVYMSSLHFAEDWAMHTRTESLAAL